MKRIAIIVSTYPPYKGGMGNVACYETEEFKKLGYDARVFTLRNNSFSINYQLSTTNYLTPLVSIGNAGVVPQLFFYLRQYDIIYFHWPFIGAEIFIFLAKIFFRKRLIVRYHMDLIADGAKGIFFRFYQKLFFPVLARLADTVIVSSVDYSAHSDFQKYYNTFRAKFVEIPFGVSENFYDKKISRDTMILFVGGLDRAHYFKGLEVLLRAFARINEKENISLSVPDENHSLIRANKRMVFSKEHEREYNATLVIVGDGALRSYYETLAQELKIDNATRFVGAVKNEQLVDWYNRAKVFVLPSIGRSEAFGLVLLEAMACGTPVIASRLPGVRSLVRDGENGFLVEPSNEAQLTEKMTEILRDEEQWKQFSENARVIAQQYRWNDIAEKVSKLF